MIIRLRNPGLGSAPKTGPSPAPWLQGLVLLAARLYLARLFFLSGLSKLASFETATALFADEYQVPILSPEVAAILATGAELVFPVLLAVGLLTRFAAAGLLAVTAVIIAFVYPDAVEYHVMVGLFLVLTAFGGGRFALDSILTWIPLKDV